MVIRVRQPATGQTARDLAEQTSENMTTAVVVALRERIIRLQAPGDNDRRRDELQALADRLAARFKEPYRSLDHGEWLYDEDGLPR